MHPRRVHVRLNTHPFFIKARNPAGRSLPPSSPSYPPSSLHLPSDLLHPGGSFEFFPFSFLRFQVIPSCFFRAYPFCYVFISMFSFFLFRALVLLSSLCLLKWLRLLTTVSSRTQCVSTTFSKKLYSLIWPMSPKHIYTSIFSLL